MANKHCFDPACLTLAEHFLLDGAPKDVKWDLAQAIQDAVEEHLLTPAEIEEQLVTAGERDE